MAITQYAVYEFTYTSIAFTDASNFYTSQIASIVLTKTSTSQDISFVEPGYIYATKTLPTISANGVIFNGWKITVSGTTYTLPGGYIIYQVINETTGVVTNTIKNSSGSAVYTGTTATNIVNAIIAATAMTASWTILQSKLTTLTVSTTVVKSNFANDQTLAFNVSFAGIAEDTIAGNSNYGFLINQLQLLDSSNNIVHDSGMISIFIFSADTPNKAYRNLQASLTYNIAASVSSSLYTNLRNSNAALTGWGDLKLKLFGSTFNAVMTGPDMHCVIANPAIGVDYSFYNGSNAGILSTNDTVNVFAVATIAANANRNFLSGFSFKPTDWSATYGYIRKLQCMFKFDSETVIETEPILIKDYTAATVNRVCTETEDYASKLLYLYGTIQLPIAATINFDNYTTGSKQYTVKYKLAGNSLAYADITGANYADSIRAYRPAMQLILKYAGQPDAIINAYMMNDKTFTFDFSSSDYDSYFAKQYYSYDSAIILQDQYSTSIASTNKQFTIAYSTSGTFTDNTYSSYRHYYGTAQHYAIAKFIPVAYTITYSVNPENAGGKPIESSIALLYPSDATNLNWSTISASFPLTYTVESSAITFATPTCNQYDFVNFSLASIPAGSNGNKSVIVTWVRKAFTVSFRLAYNLNGTPINSVIATKQVLYGNDLTIDSLSSFVISLQNKYRYDFIGFSATPDSYALGPTYANTYIFANDIYAYDVIATVLKKHSDATVLTMPANSLQLYACFARKIGNWKSNGKLVKDLKLGDKNVIEIKLGETTIWEQS